MKTWGKWKLLVPLVTIQLVLTFLITDVTGVNNGKSVDVEKTTTSIKGKGYKKGMSTKRKMKPSKTMKVVNGKSFFNPSMAILMAQDSEEWYTWNAVGTGLVINDQCLATWASNYVDVSVNPPQMYLDDPAQYTAYFPRENCDRAYHGKETYFSSPMYTEPSSYNDIALWRLANKIELGDPICGKSPIYPAPISCDRNGPPVGYKECYLIGWGTTNSSQVQAAANIVPNEVQVATISYEDCEKARIAQGVIPERSMDPNTEICINTLEGRDAICNYFDSSAPLICKYWNPVANSNNGWGWNQNSNGNGWSSNSQTNQRWVVVGQKNVRYDYTCGGAILSADRVTLYGAPLYTPLFKNCNLVCSDELQPGYQCMEKWDKGLGPVYCTPQKIQPPSNSNVVRRKH